MNDTVERLRSHLSVFKSYPKQTGADDMAGVVQSIEMAADQIEKLLAFAKEVIRGSWEGSNLDGGDIQEMAEKHGLLQPEIYDLDKHGDHEDAVPGEDTIHVFVKWMEDR